MKILFSDTHRFEQETFNAVNASYHFQIEYIDYRLTSQTAKSIESAEVICSFVSDKLDAECLKILKQKGVRLIALRSAGFNHIDVQAADKLGILVCRVPGYSPNAIAEFALGLTLSLNRKIHRAYTRVREMNFSLEGLVGFDLNGKTVGVVGAGRIGKIFAKTMAAIGCHVLISDPWKDQDLERHPGITYVDFSFLCSHSDIISLHVPLTKNTFHLINTNSIQKMKPGVLLINTGRGALIDTTALIEGLKKKSIGGAALDVYEEEENVFFHDLSSTGLEDDLLARLITFPNVLITSHQAFLTQEALHNIAFTTLASVQEYKQSGHISSAKLVSPG